MLEVEPRIRRNLDSALESLKPPPILVTGAPRSGSTWVGNVLALDPTCGYIHEPFNRLCPPGRCRAGFPHGFVYVTAENEERFLAPLRDTLSWTYSAGAELKAMRSARQMARMTRDFAYFEAMRRRRARVILKDPLALFSADWLATRFGARVVVVIRHPAAFVASLRAAGWHRVQFRIFTGQPRLMQDRLALLADQITAASVVMPDAIDAGSLLWNALHIHIAGLREEHPDWIFVRHEDLSIDPEAGFDHLFASLGLDFTPKVRASLDQFTSERGALARLSLFGTRRRTMRSSSANIKYFHSRLTPAEIDRIRDNTEAVSSLFYDDRDW